MSPAIRATFHLAEGIKLLHQRRRMPLHASSLGLTIRSVLYPSAQEQNHCFFKVDRPVRLNAPHAVSAKRHQQKCYPLAPQCPPWAHAKIASAMDVFRLINLVDEISSLSDYDNPSLLLSATVIVVTANPSARLKAFPGDLAAPGPFILSMV